MAFRNNVLDGLEMPLFLCPFPAKSHGIRSLEKPGRCRLRRLLTFPTFQPPPPNNAAVIAPLARL